MSVCSERDPEPVGAIVTFVREIASPATGAGSRIGCRSAGMGYIRAGVFRRQPLGLICSFEWSISPSLILNVG